MTMPSRFQSVVDAQIRAAQERGAFDNLPGTGKPIRGLMEPDDPMWWIRGFVHREGVPVDSMLPPSLALRREVERLPVAVRRLRTESAVRDHVEDLNVRIRRWIQIPLGPQVALRPVDVDEVVRAWRDARTPPRAPEPAPVVPRVRGRWWRRRRPAEPPPGGFDQVGGSSARWQDMHSTTAGRISSRSSGMAASQRTQRP